MKSGVERAFDPRNSEEDLGPGIEPSFPVTGAANESELEQERSLEAQGLIEKLDGYLSEAEAAFEQGNRLQAATFCENVRSSFVSDIKQGLLSGKQYEDLSERYRSVAAVVYGVGVATDVLAVAKQTFFDGHAQEILDVVNAESISGEISRDSYNALKDLIENETIMSNLSPELLKTMTATYESASRSADF